MINFCVYQQIVQLLQIIFNIDEDSLSGIVGIRDEICKQPTPPLTLLQTSSSTLCFYFFNKTKQRNKNYNNNNNKNRFAELIVKQVVCLQDNQQNQQHYHQHQV